MITSDSLEVVDLRKNPLTPQCLEQLKHAKVSFHIELPERILEEWEDLTIWIPSKENTNTQTDFGAPRRRWSVFDQLFRLGIIQHKYDKLKTKQKGREHQK